MSAGAGPDRIGISCMASELGLKGGDGYIGAHAIGHGNYQQFAGISGPDCHAHIRRRCLEQLAKFIRRLEAVPEGDGTMMDNTLIVYLSDSAEGHHPVCHEWPFILIGDLGGRLKLGNRYCVIRGTAIRVTVRLPTCTCPCFKPSANNATTSAWLILAWPISINRDRWRS